MASHALAELAAHDAAFDAIESGEGGAEQHIKMHAMVSACPYERTDACCEAGPVRHTHSPQLVVRRATLARPALLQ